MREACLLIQRLLSCVCASATQDMQDKVPSKSAVDDAFEMHDLELRRHRSTADLLTRWIICSVIGADACVC